MKRSNLTTKQEWAVANIVAAAVCIGAWGWHGFALPGTVRSAQAMAQGTASTATTKPIDGYGNIKLGQTLLEVLEHVDASDFYGVGDCINDMPVKGCFLSQAEGKFFAIEDAVPYRLQLQFNTAGRLTDLMLVFRREGGIDESTCKNIFARTLDWSVARYGRLKWRADREHSPGWSTVVHRTPGGLTFRLGEKVKGPGYLSDNLWIGWEGDPAKEPTTRHAWAIGSFFIISGAPFCDASLWLQEPSTVSRPKRDEERIAATPAETAIASAPEASGDGHFGDGRDDFGEEYPSDGAVERASEPAKPVEELGEPDGGLIDERVPIAVEANASNIAEARRKASE